MTLDMLEFATLIVTDFASLCDSIECSAGVANTFAGRLQ